MHTKNVTELSKITPESVLASIQETDRYIRGLFAETSRLFKEQADEAERRGKEEDRRRQEEDCRKEKEELKTDKRLTRLEKMIQENNKLIGGLSASNGEFCEEYFINSFKRQPKLFGEKFARVLPYLRPDPVIVDDEYDLVLRNGKTVVLIEMKYKAKVSDVGKMFKKLNTYRTNFPMFSAYQIYLCLASFRFPADVRARANQAGIVLIEQRGEIIEVVSKNLRTW